MSTRDELRATLPADREYRHAYANEILNLMVCTQIRVLREQQEMRQAQLADAIRTTQTAVSRIENVDYSSWNIRTLKKLAEAFDLRLRITFENFGTLWQDVASLNRESLERAKRIEDDPEFQISEPVNTTTFTPGTFLSETFNQTCAGESAAGFPGGMYTWQASSNSPWLAPSGGSMLEDLAKPLRGLNQNLYTGYEIPDQKLEMPVFENAKAA